MKLETTCCLASEAASANIGLFKRDVCSGTEVLVSVTAAADQLPVEKLQGAETVLPAPLMSADTPLQELHVQVCVFYALACTLKQRVGFRCSCVITA